MAFQQALRTCCASLARNQVIYFADQLHKGGIVTWEEETWQTSKEANEWILSELNRLGGSVLAQVQFRWQLFLPFRLD